MKIGSLFSGYGGLDMAVAEHFDAKLAWYAEYDKHPATIMTAHHPDITNHWDVTTIDWNTLEPVDILTGGYPCQPFSTAGLRKGQNDERHLWPYVRQAISTLRPRFVVLENVRGHLTLGFADVVADLAGVGYDAKWGVVRASDAGAPHQRARLFIVAYPNSNGSQAGINTRSGAQAARSGHPRAGFGPYAESVAQWEHVIGRAAPEPVDDQNRLNPPFVEWMMGLPEGWVTGVGIPYTAQLKALGNGVVPQQAKLALELLT